MKQVSITLIALAMSFGQFHASARTDLLRETFQNVNGDPENLVTRGSLTIRPAGPLPTHTPVPAM